MALNAGSITIDQTTGAVTAMSGLAGELFTNTILAAVVTQKIHEPFGFANGVVTIGTPYPAGVFTRTALASAYTAMATAIVHHVTTNAEVSLVSVNATVAAGESLGATPNPNNPATAITGPGSPIGLPVTGPGGATTLSVT